MNKISNDGTTLPDFLNGAIRTYMPLVVGAVVTVLSKLGVILDHEAIEGLEEFIGLLAAGIWWTAVRALERKWPRIGVLLGSTKKPIYVAPQEAEVYNISSMSEVPEHNTGTGGAVVPVPQRRGTDAVEPSDDDDTSYDGEE